MKQFIFSLFTLGLYLHSAGQYYDPKIGDTVNAIHYLINLQEINTSDQTITAYTEITLTPVFDGLDYVPLELAALTVDSVTVNGLSAGYSHANSILRIPLQTVINTNDTLVIGVYYHGKPFHEAWGGFHFSGSYAFNLGVGFESIPHNLGKTWFPCIDDFTDRATYSFMVTVDSSFKAICGGELEEVIDQTEDKKTWIWNIDNEIPTYLASVATGNYVLTYDEYFGMEDTIPITIYTRPSEVSKVEGSFIHLKEVLQWFEEKFGPYPFSRVGYTGTAIGAMEHAANIAYPHFAINGGTSYESLYVHELSHMWFGDMVTCSSAEDMWLNEGWATFCEILYLEDLYGRSEYLNTLRHEHREVLRKTHITDGGYFPLNEIPQEITYGSHAYDKGGMVANALRGYLGDSLFYNAISAFLEDFAYRSVSSLELRDFLTDYTGINMNGFFDSWVFTAGTPHYSIDSVKITPSGNQFQADIWPKQKYKPFEYIGQNHVVAVNYLTNEYSIINDTVRFSGNKGHSVKQLDFYPLAVFVDLYETMLDATTDIYKWISEPGEYAFEETYCSILVDEVSDSSLVQVTHNWVAPDSLKIPVEGLTLSPYRYWRIDGLMNEGFKATGRFTYDRNGYLDHDLILAESDSVVILYREGTLDEWEEISQTRFGLWNFGYIDVEEVKTGEYTLAVWDKYLLGVDPLNYGEHVEIYPNPSRGELNFRFSERKLYQIRIIDSKGALVDNFEINGKNKTWRYHGYQSASGVLLVQVFESGELIAARKVVFSN